MHDNSLCIPVGGVIVSVHASCIVDYGFDARSALLQAHLDGSDADNHRIENCLMTEHHLYSGSWN